MVLVTTRQHLRELKRALKIKSHYMKWNSPKKKVGDKATTRSNERASEALDRLGEQFRALRDAVLVLEGDGTIVDANLAASEMFGLRIKALRGRNVRQLIRFNSTARDDVEPTTPTRTKRPLLLTGWRASGSEFPAELTMSRYNLGDGSGAASVAVIRDVSDRQRIIELATQRDRLATIGEVMATVMHELCTPLTGIAGLAEDLAETQDEAERGTIEMILSETERASGLIRELLNFARYDSEKPSVPVNDAVERALKLSELKHGAGNVEIATDLSSEPLHAVATMGRLQQVIFNLIENAKHAVADGESCRIVITTRNGGDRIQLQVSDNGPGIPAGIRDRIFEPFFTTKEPGVGTGLGLAIVESIVEDFGGKISLDTSSRGTTFTISLKIAAPAETP